MILKTIGALGLALGIATAQLSTCSTPSVDTTAVADVAQAVCQFVPTAASIAAIVAAGSVNNTNGVDEATSIANLICGAASSVAANPGAAVPTVTDHEIAVVTINGKSVSIVGHFVPKA